MTKYVKGKDGKFAGSIGTGKSNVPTAASGPTTALPDAPDHMRGRVGYDEMFKRFTNTSGTPEATIVSQERLPDGGFHTVYSDRMHEWVNEDGNFHRADGAAVYGPADGGRIEKWYWNGRLHREGGPASLVERKDESGTVTHDEAYYRDGVLHRDNGPAMISTRATAEAQVTLVSTVYARNGVIHRMDGPAELKKEVTPSGIVVRAEHWFRDGDLHRDDFPAVTVTHSHPDGFFETSYTWYRKGEVVKHGFEDNRSVVRPA